MRDWRDVTDLPATDHTKHSSVNFERMVFMSWTFCNGVRGLLDGGVNIVVEARRRVE